MTLDNSYKQQIYKELSRYLREKDFKKFIEHAKDKREKNFYYNPSEIQDRFEILSNLLMDTIRDVSEGYETSALGEFIEILRFFNEQNLLERMLSKEDQILLGQIKKDEIFLANLMDLFGTITNYFILYIVKDIPNHFLDFFITNPNPYFPNSDMLIHYIKNVFFNQYTIYGLSVRYLGTVEKFLTQVQKELTRLNFRDKHKNNEFIELDMKYEFSDFYFSYGDITQRVITKKHLIYPENVFKYINENLDKKKKQNYTFQSLSMVLLGGIGPQGHGFTYSTPRGEIIEICSDIKENEAIIVKYKLFLKEQFINRLDKELIKINSQIRAQTISFLNSLLTPNEIIGYNKMDHILSKVENFLQNYEEVENFDIDKLYHNISDAISIILRPIRMVDQFKARMELVSQDKLKSEDLAKLTSLKNKSHYDVLRERLFFQYIVDFFYEISQKSKFKKEKW
ncbi:MAG: hypothetical protein EU531_10275 [Promethearchaeota archaeon]|nr:MAG: hypothetical protein EU531_10275 [Candidatus Lokiarchaeota archaeon]